MMPHAPKFNRERPDQRRLDLIEATLRLMARNGTQGATVRAIAEEAKVTQGLIRHHFQSKDELLCMAFEHHMSSLTSHAEAGTHGVENDPLVQLKAFVVASLSPPVVDGRAVFLWAGFMNLAQTNLKLREVHARTYCELRDLLEGLIANAFAALNIRMSDAELRAKTIACGATLDGLWLEGGALPEFFDAKQLIEIGLNSVEAILGIKFAPENSVIPAFSGDYDD